MRPALLLTTFALGRALSAEEVVLDVVNGYTKTLPRQVRYVTGDAQPQKAASKAADLQGGKVTLVVEGKPSILTVTADGFEPFKLDLRRRPSSMGLRPLASIRPTLPSAAGAILGPGSSVRVFISNSHDPRPREVAPVTVVDQGVSFQAEAGTWRGALVVDGRHVAPFNFSAAPGESRTVDTLLPFGLKTRLLAPVKEDGSPAEGVVARWHFATAVSDTQTAQGNRAAAGAEPGLTRLCEELLDMGTKRSPSNAVLRVDAPFGGLLKASLSLESPGLRRLSVGPQDIAANDTGQAARLVMRALPTMRVTVPKLRPGDDSPLTATISATAPSNDGATAGAKAKANASVVPGSSFSIRALADTDHRIEVRDGQGRMQGLARIARSDRDWPQDVINRTLRREERTISGTVLWGDAPLRGARVVALYLNEGPSVKPGEPSLDNLSLPFDKVFEVGDETSADGRFSLTVFVPGVYSVMAYHPELKYAKGGPPVDLSEVNRGETEIRIRDAYIVLEVRDDESGEPVKGALAVIRNKPKGGETAGKGTYRFKSGVDGQIRVADLLAGQLDIQITATGYRSERVDAAPASTTPIEPRRVNLQRAPSCSIRFLDEAGGPLAGAQAYAVGAEASQTIFPSYQDLGLTDDSGFLSMDSPSGGFPHLLALATGKKLKFVPSFFTVGSCAQADVFFEGRRASILPQVRSSEGKALAGVQIAFATGGVFLPWNLAAMIGSLDAAMPARFMTTGSAGEIQLAAALEDGQWQAFAFKVDGGQGVELQKRIGSFELPLSRSTTIVVTGGKK
ncbi:MAG TPA: hypothetical protein PLB01_04295 [Thermoanaerobaculia bacterium]|nr:hypothetical protein [Thermoanaerobaculia bacterium]